MACDKCGCQTKSLDVPAIDRKRPLLLFSGGLDSTYLLRWKYMYGCVDVVGVSMGQDAYKIQAETKARENIIKWMMENAEKDKGHVINDLGWVTVPSLSMTDDHALSQPAALLYALLSKVDTRIHSSVNIGYVRGDDALANRHELMEAWKNLVEVTKGKQVPLEFPLMSASKDFLVKHLEDELLERIWVCELPRRRKKDGPFTPCGRCHPCERHREVMRRRLGSVNGIRGARRNKQRRLKKHQQLLTERDRAGDRQPEELQESFHEIMVEKRVEEVEAAD